jgi:hypothetical protein
VPKLTADDWQGQVTDTLGGMLRDQGDPPDALTATVLASLKERVKSLWAMAGSVPGAAASPYLRTLHATRLGVRQLLGLYYRYVDVRLGRQGVNQSQSEVYKNLLGMLDRLDKEIAEAKKAAALAGGASAGVLTRTAPFMPGVDAVPDGTNGAGLGDPGSPVFGGWPGAGRRGAW